MTAARLGTFAKDLAFPGAPLLLPDGDFLFVEMAPEAGCITRMDGDGSNRRTVARTGRPNGLALDRHRDVWVTETAQRAVLKLKADGQAEVMADSANDQPFVFLNDLAFAPNGDLYLTDSGIEPDAFAPDGVLNPDWQNLPYDGRLYRMDVERGKLDLVDRGLKFANGVTFGADGDLYVAETLTGTVHRYPWRNGRVDGARQPFGNVWDGDLPEPMRGPDGMKFDRDGNLYVCVFGQGEVAVLDRDGAVIRRLPADGDYPTNLCFGRPGTGLIYVTEAMTGTVQTFDVGVDGLPLNG